MRTTVLKFGVFVLIMVVLSSLLVLIFSQYRTGATATFSAVFTDASRLQSGDTVRVAGIRVGTVDDVALQPDGTVVVTFDADRSIGLTTGTKAAVRYLNLVGDRYLELVDGPGSTRVLPAGSQIPVERTAPALDLDLLLGGLKPVIQGLNPADVNALSASLLQIFQGEGGTLESLFAETSSFSNSLADNSQVIESLIDNLNSVLATLSKEGPQFSAAVDKLEGLITSLSQDRDPIGNAIQSINSGTATLADLLTQGRPPIAGSIAALARFAPALDDGKDMLASQLQKLPNNYRKLVRAGAYGAWLNYYICGISLRVTDLQGRTAAFPFIKQEGGRCAEPS